MLLFCLRFVDVLPGLKAGASTPPDGSAVAPQGPPPFLPALKDGVSRRISMIARQLATEEPPDFLPDIYSVPLQIERRGFYVASCCGKLFTDIQSKRQHMHWC